MITKYNIIRIKRSREWFKSVKEDIKKTWEFIMKLQSSPDDFGKYKDSIYRLKNREFLERWNSTQCLIGGDDTEFIFELPLSDLPSQNNGGNSQGQISEQTNQVTDCLIDSTE
jgi:hypothetical protein